MSNGAEGSSNPNRTEDLQDRRNFLDRLSQKQRRHLFDVLLYAAPATAAALLLGLTGDLPKPVEASGPNTPTVILDSQTATGLPTDLAKGLPTSTASLTPKPTERLFTTPTVTVQTSPTGAKETPTIVNSNQATATGRPKDGNDILPTNTIPPTMTATIKPTETSTPPIKASPTLALQMTPAEYKQYLTTIVIGGSATPTPTAEQAKKQDKLPMPPATRLWCPAELVRSYYVNIGDIPATADLAQATLEGKLCQYKKTIRKDGATYYYYETLRHERDDERKGQKFVVGVMIPESFFTPENRDKYEYRTSFPTATATSTLRPPNKLYNEQIDNQPKIEKNYSNIDNLLLLYLLDLNPFCIIILK